MWTDQHSSSARSSNSGKATFDNVMKSKFVKPAEDIKSYLRSVEGSARETQDNNRWDSDEREAQSTIPRHPTIKVDELDNMLSARLSAPSYGGPALSLGGPAPSYGQPAPSYGRPTPSYGLPTVFSGHSAPTYQPYGPVQSSFPNSTASHSAYGGGFHGEYVDPYSLAQSRLQSQPVYPNAMPMGYLPQTIQPYSPSQSRSLNQPVYPNAMPMGYLPQTIQPYSPSQSRSLNQPVHPNALKKKKKRKKCIVM